MFCPHVIFLRSLPTKIHVTHSTDTDQKSVSLLSLSLSLSLSHLLLILLYYNETSVAHTFDVKSFYIGSSLLERHQDLQSRRSSL